MAILATGYSYSDDDQVTSSRLNSAINSSTFASGAVDGSTTQLSSGAIIVKDRGVTAAKLESATNGQLFIGNGTGFTKASLTAGTNITITPSSGGITISAAGGGSGSIGGSTGGTDNALLRADGSGGSTLQNSAISVDDSGNMSGGAIADFTTAYRVNGTQILGIQQAAVSDFAATSISGTGDDAGINANFSSIETKLNSLLAKLRTHGIIAT